MGRGEGGGDLSAGGAGPVRVGGMGSGDAGVIDDLFSFFVDSVF